MSNFTSPKSNPLVTGRLLITLLAILISASAFSQVPGCKDPMANNYNPAATVNDGKCNYNPTSYAPPVKTDPMNAILNENSGLQMADNFLWTFNDGGGAAAIYRVDTVSDVILQTVNLGGATNTDWEDIAFDGTNFYIGDFGNNDSGSRTDLKIYKFPLSAIADYTTNPMVTIPQAEVATISFTYSDQGTPRDTTLNSTKFDCEAMIVDNGQIHLFTKNWVDVNSVHYVINGLAAGNYIATPVDTLETGYLVTAADKAPRKNLIVLLGYQPFLPVNHFLHLLSDYSDGKYFNGNKRRIDLPNAVAMGQAEGITFRSDTYGYIGNERVESPFITVTQKLHSFNITDFVPLYVLPLWLKDFSVKSINATNRISWDFNAIVQNVKVEYSTDGINFNVLKTYTNSLKDVFYDKALHPVNYYRISWQNDNGGIQHSNIISIKNEVPLAIRNFVLKANGYLTFQYAGTAPAKFSFKLLSIDGKVLAHIKEQSYAPGLNKIAISLKPILNNFIYLSVFSGNTVSTTLLRVEK